MFEDRLTQAEKNDLKRDRALAKLAGCGLPDHHPALENAKSFVRGAQSPDTARTTVDAICMYLAFMGERNVDPIPGSRALAREFVASLVDHYAPASQGGIVGRVHSWYEELIAGQLLQFNPFKRIRPSSTDTTEPTPVLTAEDLDNALRIGVERVAEDDSLTSLRNFTLVYVGCRLGFRRSEYQTLMFGGRREARLRVAGKGQSVSYVIVPPDVDDVLDLWLTELARAIRRPLRADDAIFPVLGLGDAYLRHGDLSAALPALAPAGVVHVIKSFLADAGITGPRIASHVLRATAATLASDGGAHRLDVQALLRHRTATMADLYIRRNKDRTAAEKWCPAIVIDPSAIRASSRRRRRAKPGDEAGKAAA